MHLAALHFSTILIHFLVKPHMKSNFHVQNHEFKKFSFKKCRVWLKLNSFMWTFVFTFHTPFCEGALLKTLLGMNVLNGVTAALFSVSFFLKLAVVKKDTENGAAVTSLRTFIWSNGFSKTVLENVLSFVKTCRSKVRSYGMSV